MSTGPVAAVDCGTNSTRLLVVDAHGRTLERLMTITRLGEDVDRTGSLTAGAIDRTAATLARYQERIAALGAVAVRCAATSAARDATNRDDFFAAARAALGGVAPELLSGEEEARLSFAGATADLRARHDGSPVLVADIGGGSTELVVGVPGQEPVGAVSVDVGCVRLSERHIEHDPARPEELANAVGYVRDVLADDVDRNLPQAHDARELVGLAGTVACLASLDLGLTAYDRDRIHHHRISRDEVEDWFRVLATGDREDRLANPGMEEGRVDVIVGGMCVLVSIFRHYDFDEVLVSEADILDGLCASLLGRSRS